MHAGGGTNDRGEKRNVLIVSVLLLIGSHAGPIPMPRTGWRQVQMSSRNRMASVGEHGENSARNKDLCAAPDVKDDARCRRKF